MKSRDRSFSNVSQQRSKTMSHIRRKDTNIEIVLRKALWNKGYRYRKNYKALPETIYICITRYKIAIFCDGEFFHGKDWGIHKQKVTKGNNGIYWIKKIEENIERDKIKDKNFLFMR